MLRIFLIWVIALIAGSGWFLLRGESGLAGNSADTVALASEVPLERVEQIELQYRDGRLLVFERNDSGWRQVKPFPVGVETFSARQLGAVAADLRGSEVSLEEEGSGPTSTQLGLDPAAATITWRWPEGEHSVSLGNRTLAGRAWARVGEEPRAVLVEAELHERVLETDDRLWRDRLLAPNAGTNTNQILIQAGNEQLELERAGTGWKMTTPVSTRADGSAVADWLARLSRAKAEGYLYDEPEDLDRFGLDVPIARVELLGKDAEGSHVIIIGDPIGVGMSDRYAMVLGSPSVVRISEEIQRILVPTAATLVDATGSGIVRENIARFEVRTPPGAVDLELERDFDQWVLRVDEAEPVPVDGAAVERFLMQLTNSRSGELAFNDYPQELEQAIVVFYGFDGAPLDTVRIAREPEGGRWALENGDGVLRIFPASLDPAITPEDFELSSP